MTTDTHNPWLLHRIQQLEKKIDDAVQQAQLEYAQLRLPYRYAPIPAVGWVQAQPQAQANTISIPAGELLVAFRGTESLGITNPTQISNQTQISSPTQISNDAHPPPLTTLAPVTLFPYQLTQCRYQTVAPISHQAYRRANTNVDADADADTNADADASLSITLTPTGSTEHPPISLKQLQITIHPAYTHAANLFYYLQDSRTKIELQIEAQTIPFHTVATPLFCLAEQVSPLFDAYLNPLGLFLNNPRFDLRITLEPKPAYAQSSLLNCPAALPLTLRFLLKQPDCCFEKTLTQSALLFNAIPVIQWHRQRSDWCHLGENGQAELRLDRYKSHETDLIHSIQTIHTIQNTIKGKNKNSHWGLIRPHLNTQKREKTTPMHYRLAMLQQYPKTKPRPEQCYADVLVMSSTIPEITQATAPLYQLADQTQTTRYDYTYQWIYADPPRYPICLNLEEISTLAMPLTIKPSFSTQNHIHSLAQAFIETLRWHDLTEQHNDLLNALTVEETQVQWECTAQHNHRYWAPCLHHRISCPSLSLSPAMQYIWQRQCQAFLDHHRGIHGRQTIVIARGAAPV